MPESAFRKRLQLVPLTCSGIVASLTTFILILWFFVPSYKEIPANVMKANTALGLLCASVALFCLRDVRSHRRRGMRSVGLAAAGVFLMIGVLTTSEYLFGWDLGIDQFLVTDFFSEKDLLFPGRMSPMAAVAFVIVGFSFFILDHTPRRGVHPVSVILIAANLGSMFAIVGYLYGEKTFYQFGPYLRISWLTAICVFVLTLGMLFIRRERDAHSALTSPRLGGVIARRLLPTIIVYPVLLGYIKIHGRVVGLFDEEFGTAALVLALIVVLVVVVVFISKRLNALDEEQDLILQREQDALESLNLALSATGMGTWQWDLRTHELKGNEQHQRLLGFDSVDVGRAFEAFIDRVHPADRSRLFDIMERAKQERQPFDCEYRIVKADGDVRWMASRGVHIFKPGHVEPFRASGVIFDITEKKAALEEVQKVEDQIVSIVTSSPLILWALDTQGRYVIMQGEALQRVGLNPDDVIGKNYFDLLQNNPEAIDYARRALQGESFSAETEFMGRWHSTHYAPFADEDGRIIGMRGVSTDITERKLAELQLQRALQARDEFLSIASHELKTPLTSLRLQSQLFMRRARIEPDATIAKEQLETMTSLIDKQISKITRLVDDMLDISRIRSGKLIIERQELDLCDLVRETVEQLKTQFSTSSYVVPKLDFCSHAVGFWDKMRLEQVVSNLLTNAIRYGKGNLITLAVTSTETTVTLSVRDQGIGIAPENHEIIFDRFERAVHANEVSGLGLGLFISKQIVLAHQGKIWVESDVGSGSTFYVELPRS